MLDWAIPILSIIAGVAITAWLFFGWAAKKPGKPEKSAPICPGCSVDNCAAMGGGDDVDMETIRRKLVERGEEPTEQADSQ